MTRQVHICLAARGATWIRRPNRAGDAIPQDKLLPCCCCSWTPPSSQTGPFLLSRVSQPPGPGSRSSGPVHRARTVAPTVASTSRLSTRRGLLPFNDAWAFVLGLLRPPDVILNPFSPAVGRAVGRHIVGAIRDGTMEKTRLARPALAPNICNVFLFESFLEGHGISPKGRPIADWPSACAPQSCRLPLHPPCFARNFLVWLIRF
ncbi:hypothetical protein B0T26DRAFT_464503 [Lasiosphaeria miniovina]|uniref:Uncharacterized protein n=1 Tax=Lasiosphaeria miniovina TaxID=1954250 RepID=A0AA39ZZR2_9PEZI|nr:uncharacterized protein B0T26DRAFT_464503 [Lasiosphaeria miniovina]KAK0706630.1 hypothetical protein B0T26DRAFT_464503 [Lasiosphaeria miniovina]